MSAPNPKNVLTPYGPRPAQNVHLVPEGGEVRIVGDKIDLRDADGKVIHTAPKEEIRVRSTPVGSAPAPVANGWVAYAYWSNPSNAPPISGFSAKWKVPPAPHKFNSQTIFLFNSIEPASGDAILQPVLQYGPSAAGGGKYYSVASWWLIGSQVYYTALSQVSVGQELTGIIKLTSPAGKSPYNYTSEFAGLARTKLTATGVPNQLVWATETLEVYNCNSNDELPPGSTSFYDINVCVAPAVTWSTVSDAADKISTKVDAQGAINGKVTITF